jgi:hypothetical protein
MHLTIDHIAIVFVVVLNIHLEHFCFKIHDFFPIVLCQPQAYFFMFFNWLHFPIQALFKWLS